MKSETTSMYLLFLYLVLENWGTFVTMKSQEEVQVKLRTNTSDEGSCEINPILCKFI